MIDDLQQEMESTGDSPSPRYNPNDPFYKRLRAKYKDNSVKEEKASQERLKRAREELKANPFAHVENYLTPAEILKLNQV